MKKRPRFNGLTLEPMPERFRMNLLADIPNRMGPDARDDLLRLLSNGYESYVSHYDMNRQYHHYRLPPDVIAAIKKQIALLIARDSGGRYRDRGVCYCSDGEKFWTELP